MISPTVQRASAASSSDFVIDPNAKPAHEDLLARNLGVPDGQHVAGIGRAHFIRALGSAAYGRDVFGGSSQLKGGPQTGPSAPTGTANLPHCVIDQD